MLKLIKFLIVTALLLGIVGGVGWFVYDTIYKPKQQAKMEAAQPTPTPPPDPALKDLRAAEKLKAEGKLAETREALEKLIEQNPQSSVIDGAQQLLGEVNSDLFFSASPSPDKELYVVQKGDALAKIQRRFKTTAELIMRTNNLTDPTRLQIGQQLLIPRVEFSLAIKRQEQKIVLMNRGKFFKRYKVVKWNAPAKGGGAGIKVQETAAFNNGTRVAFGTKEFAASIRWVMLTANGYTIYGETGDGAESADRPQTGIGVTPEDADELATLLSRGVPVTIE